MTSDKKTLLSKLRISKISLFLALCCIIAIGAGGYFFVKYQNSEKEKNANAELIDKIGKVIQLPSETPIAASVADRDKLSNKALAAKVENGDVMLIFSKAKRLVVYRPSVSKVVDMLTFGSDNEVTTQTQVQVQPQKK